MSSVRRSHPIANFWRKRSRSKSGRQGPVGTEAVAIANIEQNSRNFNYPDEGFVTRIEHSLLYAMISEPKMYPDAVIKEHIAEEDFSSYLLVAPSNNNRKEEEPRISYAQLSAIMALAAEKIPPPQEDDQVTTTKKRGKQREQPLNNPQRLCKACLQCVVRYAEEHDLDRKAEVQELLDPVASHAAKRGEKAALIQALPFYVGYYAALVTLNPIPMLLGAAATSAIEQKDGSREEQQNVDTFASETERRADVEKTSLLDEIEEEQ